MIPKKIHYVWFGGKPLTPLAERCLASWREFCPDYEIVRWDETNFDVRANRYCREAVAAGKWAFASDYARLWVLVNEGGIYMDTDVEVLRPLDRFLGEEAFSGFEAPDRIPTGIMAAVAHQPFFEQLLADYDGRSFLRPDGTPDLTTNVTYITEACLSEGLVLKTRGRPSVASRCTRPTTSALRIGSRRKSTFRRTPIRSTTSMAHGRAAAQG